MNKYMIWRSDNHYAIGVAKTGLVFAHDANDASRAMRIAYDQARRLVEDERNVHIVAARAQ